MDFLGQRKKDFVRPISKYFDEKQKQFNFLCQLWSKFFLDFFDQKWSYFDCALRRFPLCSIYVSTALDLFSAFSTKIGYVWTVLDLCFVRARPIFRTKLGMFWLPMFRISRQKSGRFSLCARFKIASRLQNFGRKTALARLSNSKYESSTASTCLVSLGQKWVCFDSLDFRDQ